MFHRSLLQSASQEARKAGEGIASFKGAFVVLETPDPNHPGQIFRYHEPIRFETLTGLKNAVSMYGPTRPFVLTSGASLRDNPLTSHDWSVITSARPNGGEALLWKAEFRE